MTENEILKILSETGALLTGHFELRSGLHSNQFFQCANALKYPRIAERLCGDLVAAMLKSLGRAPVADAVIAPALGGIIVGHEIARVLDLPFIFAEKQDGKLVLRRFSIEKGQRFIVAEDVVTRGGRVQETIDIVKNNGGTVAAVAMLVDRSGSKARFEYPAFSLLKMAPVTYEPAECPMCRKNIPLVHPGS
ncbi:MAG: orotate phosphoribosyltransferase [Lentisphaerae bacterium]|nr:orotate phosphoribosyltransferase [Lentisphaerota bacterium]